MLELADYILLISEILILLLAGYTFRLMMRFYEKTKSKKISILFSSILIIWVTRAVLRLMTGLEITPRPDVWVWSIIGAIEILLIVILFNYKIKLLEKYL
jgi:hypothetical protein